MSIIENIEQHVNKMAEMHNKSLEELKSEF